MTPSPDLAILGHLAARTHDTAIGVACATALADVGACLVTLESMRLVASFMEWENSRS